MSKPKYDLEDLREKCSPDVAHCSIGVRQLAFVFEQYDAEKSRADALHNKLQIASLKAKKDELSVLKEQEACTKVKLDLERAQAAGIEAMRRAEQAEAALKSALQVNAARQAEGLEKILNGMMAGITGEKESVRLELGGFHCPYCNEVSKTIEAATEHDATCPKHPAVIRAEKAEAENARLTKVVNWMADKLGTRHPDCPLKYLKQRPLGWKCHEGSQGPCTKAQAVVCWAEAARRAVAAAAGEE